MVEDLAKFLAGFGFGWIASWFFVVRPTWHLVRDMRYAGFRHEPPPPRIGKPGPQLPDVNET